MRIKKRVRDIPDGNAIAGARMTIERQDDGGSEASGVSDSEGWIDIQSDGAPGDVWITTQRGTDRYFDDSRQQRPFGPIAPVQLAGLLNSLHGDGITPYGDQFAIQSSGAGSITVGTGAALLDGTLGVWYSNTTVSVGSGDRALAVLWSGTGRMTLVDVAYASLTATHVPIWRYTVSGGSISAITSIATPILLGIISRRPTLQSVARLASGSTANASGEAAGLSTTMTLANGIDYQVEAEASVISRARAGAIAVRIDGNLSSYAANGGSITTTLKNAHARTITGSGAAITIEMYDRNDETTQPSEPPTLAYDSQFGSFGTGNGSFQYPQQIAFDSSDNIYVADYGNNRLQKFNSSGVWQASITGLTSITGVCVDSSNNLYVAYSGAIRKYSSALVLQWTNTVVATIAHISTDNTNIYVASPSHNLIVKYLCSTGATVTSWGSAGSGNGQFQGPWGLATDGTHVWVSDYILNRVQKFTVAGTYVAKWGSSGTGNGQFDQAKSVALDAANSLILVADQNNHRIQRFTSAGAFQDIIGGFGTGNGQFNKPRDARVNSAGAIWVSDGDNHRLQKFTLQGGSGGGTFPFDWDAGLLIARAIPRG